MSGFNKLPIGIDLDGTAFQHPAFFAELLRVWEGKTYALTARQKSKNTLDVCDNLGLRFDEFVWDLCDNEAKSQKVQELGLVAFFDDMPEFLLSVPHSYARRLEF